MEDELKLIAKSKLEEIYHDQAELVDALRHVLEMFDWYGDPESEIAYKKAVAILGKITQSKGE